MGNLTMKDIGPLQLLAVSFNKPAFKGKINKELQKLRDQDLIRLIDGMAVQKSESGKMKILRDTDLSADESRDYGAIIGGLIGLSTGDANIARRSSDYMAEEFHQRYEYGLDKEDLEDLADNIPSGESALILLIEHKWLLPFRNSLREAGGLLLSQDFLSPELMITLGQTTRAS